MTKQDHGITRRGFVGAAAAATVGSVFAAAGLAGCGSQPKEEAKPKEDPEPKKEEAPKETPEPKAAAEEKPAVAQPAELNPQDESYDKCTTDFAPLFEPLNIGKLTLRNRIVKSPGGSDTWAPEGDQLNENYLTYYENFAKGGAAMVFVESAISKFFSIKIKDGERSVSGWLLEDFSKIPTLMAPVVERVHKHDAYIGFQLAAGSADIPTMTLEDIEWLQNTMVDVAVQIKEAGFDIIELHSSATQLMKNMLTARVNTREDQYGADTLENRTRFTCEVIQKIKEACGADFPIQVLMDACEENDAKLGDNDNFITLEESIENAKMFEAAGADTIYLRQSVPGMHIAQFAPDLMHSGYRCNGVTGFGTQVDFSQHFGGTLDGRYSGCGMLLPACAEFKKNLKIPVSAAGYLDPRTAPDLIVGAIANGELDYIMTTRPLTVDPELPNKLKEGRRDEVAPCTRCMHCHNKGGDPTYDYTGKGVELCRVNAATQRAYTEVMPEGYEPLPAETKKTVMVIGGGPAGMEAARIAAQRGHEVTLYEKGAALGGLLPMARAFKGNHERLSDLVDYLTRQQELKGVTVKTGTEVTADMVKSENPDAVIVAVGGQRESKLKGTGKVNVLSVEQAGGSDVGENVVICGANAQAVDCALFLLAEGKKVQMVHEGLRSDIDKEQSTWVRTFVTPQLYAKGVKVWNSTTVDGLTDAGLAITNSMGAKKTLACDTVIECYDMVPNKALADALSSFEVYTVGDCDTPFNIAQAIASGNLAARKL